MTDLANASVSSRRTLLNRAGYQLTISDWFPGGEIPVSLIRYFLRLLLQRRNGQVHDMSGGASGLCRRRLVECCRPIAFFGEIQSGTAEAPHSITYA